MHTAIQRIIAFLFILTGGLYFVGIPMFVEWVSAYEYTYAEENTHLLGEYHMWGPFPLQGNVHHVAEGNLFIYESDSSYTIKFTDFHMLGSSGLVLALSEDFEGKNILELYSARSFAGSPGYHIPQNIELKKYRYVMHLHKPTGIVFNRAAFSLE